MSALGRLALGAALLASLTAAAPAAAEPVRDRDVYAEVTPDRITLGNAVAERSWSREAFVTLELLDKRGGGRVWSRNAPDFRLLGLGAPITSDQFTVTGAEIEHLAARRAARRDAARRARRAHRHPDRRGLSAHRRLQDADHPRVARARCR